MRKVKVGLIRVVTLGDKELMELHGKIIEKNIPELIVISECIPNQPYGIYDEISEREAIPKIISLGVKMVKKDVRALIVSCAADPGVIELRRKVNVPVIGAGSAVAHIAASIADEIGVLTMAGELPKVISEILGDKIKATAYPANVKNTLDLMRNETLNEIFRAARKLEEIGCKVILLACTGYSTINAAEKLRKVVNIPVIDPVVASGYVTLMAIKSLKYKGGN